MESQQFHRKFSASEVANDFVTQYYSALKNCPDQLYMFYKDCSTITRPEPNGQMVHLKSIEAIKNNIVSLHSEGNEAKIRTVDSQEAADDSYIILVTGVILGHNNFERKFAQSFFLAPQEIGYFVLTDVFRYLEEPQYLEEPEYLEEKTISVNGVSDEPLQEELAPALESRPSGLDEKTISVNGVSDEPLQEELAPALESRPSGLEEKTISVNGVSDEPLQEELAPALESRPSGLDEKTISVNGVSDEPLQEELAPALESRPSGLDEEEATEVVKNEQLTSAELVPGQEASKFEKEQTTETVNNEQQKTTVGKMISPPEEKTKKSFLSVLLKENSRPIQGPTAVVKFPINPGLKGNVPSQVQATSQSLNPNSTLRSGEAPVSENSIFIRNLPWNATITLVEEEFKKYGPIKPGGIQIRSNKEQHFCYGFLEFQSSTSMESAIKASPIVISGRRIYVQKKRLSGSRGNIPNGVKGGGNPYGRSGYARHVSRNF